MWSYEITWSDLSYIFPSMSAYAFNLELISFLEGITLNVRVISSPKELSSNGIEAGVDCHPDGSSSLRLPDNFLKLDDLTFTLMSRGLSSLKIITLSARLTNTGGTTSNGRNCSPLTGSVHLYRRGCTNVNFSPPTVSWNVKETAG